MLIRQLASIFKCTRYVSPSLCFQFASKKLNTQVFSELSWGELATPQLAKSLILKPIHNHSMLSQRSLFHKKRVSRRVKSCFSEKKHLVYRKVNKVKKYFYSDILKQKIFATVSMKAYKCIKKMGSFDTYILCTKPKDLDSKLGEYYRELMLRKINDDNFRIPYIIGTGRKTGIKKYSKYRYIQEQRRIPIPRQFKETFRTFQRRFGARPQELDAEDYKKYVELNDLKQKLGNQLDPAHPLLLELREKMREGETDQELQKLQQISKKAEQDFLNGPNYKQYRKLRVDKAKKQIEMMQNKLREISFKVDSNSNNV